MALRRHAHRKLTSHQRVRVATLKEQKETARLRAARLEPIVGMLDAAYDAFLFDHGVSDLATELSDALRIEQDKQLDVHKLRLEEIKAIEESG